MSSDHPVFSRCDPLLIDGLVERPVVSSDHPVFSRCDRESRPNETEPKPCLPIIRFSVAATKARGSLRFRDFMCLPIIRFSVAATRRSWSARSWLSKVSSDHPVFSRCDSTGSPPLSFVYSRCLPIIRFSVAATGSAPPGAVGIFKGVFRSSGFQSLRRRPSKALSHDVVTTRFASGG